MRKIEVCCASLDEAREAQAGGAVRIELCSALGAGGITPSAGTIAAVARAEGLTIDVNVLIRAREGSFLYTREEVDIMVRDIELCRREGVHGVVIGALTADGDIDAGACRRMVEAAGGHVGDVPPRLRRMPRPAPRPRADHRTRVRPPAHVGQQATAEAGAGLIARLVEQAAGRIIVMPGSGIRPSNIAAIERVTRATEFHSTARGAATDDGMRYRNPSVSFAADPAEEHVVRRSDPQRRITACE